MNEGRIIKLIGGVYTVQDLNDRSTHSLRPRGIFRHKNESPKVGDLVRYDETLIQEILPRTNELVRPPIVNVDQALLINSTKSPNFSAFLLDRFLILAHQADIEPIIVINKIDLLGKVAYEKLRDEISHYEKYYRVFYVSAKDPSTLKAFKEVFEDRLSVLAGQTGSGKSSLLNAIDPSLDLKTGETSKALGRGRHTTRHTELLELCGGLIADTPGFSKLDFHDIEADELTNYYLDFLERIDGCKFRGCRHINEPSCAIKKAVEDGEIPKERYNNYRRIHEELQAQKKYY